MTDPITYTEWVRYFAWIPVTVDAFTEDERAQHNNHFRWKKWGWVERRYEYWVDNDDDQTPRTTIRYREIPR